jgi:predicted ribosomally synthesized peptide with nif11-like leader
MSDESASRFLRRVASDPALQQRLADQTKGLDSERFLAVVAEQAAALGFQVGAAELMNALYAATQVQPLSEDVLARVTGGTLPLDGGGAGDPPP